jgi:tetratricopeptide (TPR) repeat protein
LAQEHPKSPDFVSDLGATLHNLATLDLNAKRFDQARDRLQQAVECQRKALAIQPTNPTYRRSLDTHLGLLINAARGLGDIEGASEAERERAKLRDSDPAIVALDARLAGVISGGQSPKNNRERLQLAQRAYDKSLHASAARLWSDVIASDAKLRDDRQVQHRYNAACAAALAAAGQSKDDPKPDDAARASLRAQALVWLNGELDLWRMLVNDPKARPVIVQTLKHWQEDADLASVRDAPALESLPEAERGRWRALWNDVASLLSRLEARPAAARKR